MQKVIYNFEWIGFYSELIGFVVLGDWIDFFCYVLEFYDGVLFLEYDFRNFKEMLIFKMMVVKDKFDVYFVCEY